MARSKELINNSDRGVGLMLSSFRQMRCRAFHFKHWVLHKRYQGLVYCRKCGYWQSIEDEA